MKKKLFYLLNFFTFTLFFSCSKNKTPTIFPIEIMFHSPTAIYSPQQKEAMRLMTNPKISRDCSFLVDFHLENNHADCFGPQLNFFNHPEGTTPYHTKRGDIGLTQNAEISCAVEELNTQVSGVAKLVNTGLLMMANAFCVSTLNSIPLPEIDETIDLTRYVSDNYRRNDLKAIITSVSIKRLVNDFFGRSVFLINLSGADIINPHQLFEVRLKHTMDASLHAGKLSMKVFKEENNKKYTDAFSLSYEKSQSNSVTYQLLSGRFNGFPSDPYLSKTNYTIDVNKKYSLNNPSGWVENFHWARFNFNPLTGAGNFYWIIQDQYDDAYTRAFNLYLNDSMDSLTGCLYAGFSTPLVNPFGDNNYTGVIDRMFCNLNGPQGNWFRQDFNGLPYVQRQCFNNAKGTFTNTSSNTFFAPTSTCLNNDENFKFYPEGGKVSEGPQIVQKTDYGFLVGIEEVSSNMSLVGGPQDVD